MTATKLLIILSLATTAMAGDDHPWCKGDSVFNVNGSDTTFGFVSPQFAQNERTKQRIWDEIYQMFLDLCRKADGFIGPSKPPQKDHSFVIDTSGTFVINFPDVRYLVTWEDKIAIDYPTIILDTLSNDMLHHFVHHKSMTRIGQSDHLFDSEQEAKEWIEESPTIGRSYTMYECRPRTSYTANVKLEKVK